MFPFTFSVRTTMRSSRQSPIWWSFSMPSDASKLPEQVLQPPVEAGAALPSDDRLAAELRGSGPLGILAILVIGLTGNVVVGKIVVLPIGAVLVLLWIWRSRTPWRE